jgi:ketosteroid isomerase-like protein
MSGRCEPVQKVVPNGNYRAGGEQFGSQVSIAGNVAAVGAPGEGSTQAGIYYGGVYVFARQASGDWTLQGSELLPSPFADANFGSAVSLDASGQRLVVGASRESVFKGAVYIFDLVGGVWTQQAKLLGQVASGELGSAVSVQGDRVLVGSKNYGSSPGYAFIFDRQADGTWPATGIPLYESDGSVVGDSYGMSVSLSGDRALVGSMRREAYVFARQSDGSWTQEQILTPTGGQTTDQFGTTVSLSGDRALVGANQDSDKGTKAGAIYVFERQASGTWMQTAKLYGPAPINQDLFGYSVAVAGDTVLAGAIQRSQSSPAGTSVGSAGAAFLFQHNTDGSWGGPYEVKTSSNDVAASRDLGYDVALSGDFAIMGAAFDGPFDYGSAYIADLRAALP